MFRTAITTGLAFALAGCTALPDWALFAPGRKATASDQPGQYNFAWRLSGDRAVAPLQVFDNGRKMWLQFAPEQALPAIFANAGQGDRPVEYLREGPYVVLSKVWPRLVLRGGHLTSYVDRITNPPVPHAGHAQALALSGTGAAAIAPLADTALSTDQALPGKSEGLPVPDVAVDLPGMQDLSAAPAGKPAMSAAPLVAEPAAPDFTASSFALRNDPIAHYEVSPVDQNLRVALARWAQSAGWTFDTEHWAVDADIPIVGSASFQPKFKLAVQELVASTELADRPLQPCFYSNKVLRIVPYAQSCDRTAALAEAS